MHPFSYPIVHFFRLRILKERKSGKCTLHLKPLRTSTLSGLLCRPHQKIPLSGLESESLSFPKGPNLKMINRNTQFCETLCHWCFPWKNKSGVRGPVAVLLTIAVYWAESEGSTQSFGPELCAELTTGAWPGASQVKKHRSFFPHYNGPNN